MLIETALFVGGPYLDVRTDCLTFMLLAPKQITARFDNGEFHRFMIPAHAESDGASIPEAVQRANPSLRSRMFGAAFAHDSAYRGTLLEWDGAWLKANLDRAQSDSLIKALMFIEAVSDAEREIVYEVLRIFGAAAWREDRA